MAEKQEGGVDEAGLAKIAVLGGGSFGSAVASVIARKYPSVEIALLVRRQAQADEVNALHTNSRYLQGMALPANVKAYTAAAAALAGVQYIVHAVPTQQTRAFLEGIKRELDPAAPVFTLSKGLEAGTAQTVSQVIAGVLGPAQPIVVLSGPSFAGEIAEGRPTVLVAASQDRALAKQAQSLLAYGNLRINISTDVVGVEMCGALKNVLALASGIVSGLGLGQNALAAIVAQGCAEIKWLITAMGAEPETVAGVAGVGDIMLTCFNDTSRNRTVGIQIGKGENLDQVLDEASQVVEGVKTASVVVALAREYKVPLPTMTAVAQVVNRELTPIEAVEGIMSLPQIAEL